MTPNTFILINITLLHQNANYLFSTFRDTNKGVNNPIGVNFFRAMRTSPIPLYSVSVSAINDKPKYPLAIIIKSIQLRS